jgi:hypothetical protein
VGSVDEQEARGGGGGGWYLMSGGDAWGCDSGGRK